MKARGRKIYSNEYIEGFYTDDDNFVYINDIEVYPYSVEYQIRDSWYSMEELEAVAELIEVMRFKE